MRAQILIVPLEETLSSAHSMYEKSMSAYALFKINDLEASKDLVQDTFIKAWRYLARGGKVDFMKPFLYHILNQLIIDEYRKKKKTTSLDALIEVGDEPGIDYAEQIISECDGKAAQRLVEHLPNKYKRVIHMRYKEDLSRGDLGGNRTKEKHRSSAGF